MAFNPSSTAKVVAGLVVSGAAVLGAMSQWEGDGSKVYADKLAGGIPTVCSGHTDWKLRVGTAYSKEECDKIDSKNAEKYGLAIIACSGHTEDKPVFINQHEFDAHTLRAINIGIAGECGSRSMKLLKAGMHEESCDAIAHGPDGTPVWSYTNGGAKFVRGLYNRRLFEREWCLTPMPAPQPTQLASASEPK
jgi:lysozyme